MAPNKEDGDGGVAFTRHDPSNMATCEIRDSNMDDLKPSLANLTSREFGPPSKDHNVLLQSLGAPHVGSFDYMVDSGLNFAVADIDPIEFKLPDDCGGHKIVLKLEEAGIDKPSVPPGTVGVMDSRVFPAEARQRGISYKGRCWVRASYTINDIMQPMIEKSLGNIPIMVRSAKCQTSGMCPEELVSKGEQESEWGGTFVVGGHERLIRMLLTTRRNFPVAMQRPSWKNRGKNFSDFGILIDCSKPDLTTVKNVLHFVTTGTAKFMFNVGKELFFVPVIMILKALCQKSDAAIYEALSAGTDPEDHYYKGCLRNMLQEPQEDGLFTSDQIREYIGHSFREKLRYIVPEWYSNKDVCDYLMRKSVAIHLAENEDKFNLIVFMIKKLFALVQDKCVVEGVDSVMMQEVVLGGHLYLQLLKEKLESWLMTLKLTIMKRAKMSGGGGRFDLTPQTMGSCLQKTLVLERMFENFVGTGNLPSITGLGLMQNKGLTIMAENINRMRYMSHFRAIHRGSFFQEMRTTEVRALLPDAWGFVCPVHTPDGAPCGLLNHLAMSVHITTEPENSSKLPQLLSDLGVSWKNATPNSYSVMLDGKMMGYVRKGDVDSVVNKLRILKVNPKETRISTMTEVVHVPKRSAAAGQYPGIFIFTGASRMMRPVMNLALDHVEWIGTFEQIYLDISINNVDDEDLDIKFTHKELNQTAFLSNLARTIPLPDFNQSPRNMYQCQMGKQTMATPTHTWHLNAETKMYRLQTPTSPLFRPSHYDAIEMDSYPMGTNAIVAVISYTGYDMEDAMIINRASLDRGFCYGTVYKASFIDLVTVAGGKKPRNSKESERGDLVFERDPTKPLLARHLDSDGLPYPGQRLNEGDPFYCFRNDAEGKYVVKKYEGKEEAFVDSIKCLGNDTGSSVLNRVNICLRIQRGPSIGDKFASRAGQKGICSQQWPSEDLPWTESGLVPDIVFNPHGFPSRMTIAMMIECMAGKSGALHGLVHDATPFRFGSDEHPDNDAIRHFSDQLEMAGYNYYGTETLYSGTDGIPMTADIFFGVIHYQRLRHMVSDKFQVRSHGPVDMVTRQPIKGRRRGGGVRFGEMERDCLLSHGSVFLLQDRLFHGSDKTRVKVCVDCGSLLSPRVMFPTAKDGEKENRNFVKPSALQFREHKAECVTCKSGVASVRDLNMPYIFCHLVSQLAAVNIKVKINTKFE